jgi:methylated-DNA-[protein]-cysteine S-methyltransferase
VIGIAAVEAPWGPIHVAADADGLVALEVLTTPGAFAASVGRRLGEPPRAEPGPAVRRRLDATVAAVEAHLAGRPDAFGDLPIALRGLSDWDRLVLGGVRRVPWGEVTSYGRLARAIGRPGAARAAGGSVGRNPIGLAVPCHRVIAGDGSLGGYGGSWLGDREALLEIKRTLLALEGSDPRTGTVRWTTFGDTPG